MKGMTTRDKAPARDSTPEPAAGAFEPRGFAAPSKAPHAAPRGGTAADLLNAYIQRRQAVPVAQSVSSPPETAAATETPQAEPAADTLDSEEDGAEFLDKTFEEDIAYLIEATGRKEVKIGTELHHVELRWLATGLDIGIASEWTSIISIIQTLSTAAGQPNTEITGRQADINAIFAPVQQARTSLTNLEQAYKDAQAAATEARQGVSVKSRAWRTVVSAARTAAQNARTRVTSASLELVKRCKSAIQRAWEEFGEFLPGHLIPASVVFQDRDFSGDTDTYTYHTGAADDPIPIMWYKAPGDYPTIHYGGRDYAYDDAVDIAGTLFGVRAANDPAETALFKLKKVAHNETRQGQKHFNDLFNDNGVAVGGKAAPALGERGGFDGDHVKDLGFGGKDQADNYWPLAAGINRRAFNGYNSRYIVNYLDADLEGKSRAIGGLIGKYFVVKGFCNGPVPAETGSAIAGTHTLA